MNLRQVARAAGLSVAATSFALRDSPKVSLATRVRVRELALQLGYQADARVIEAMRHIRKPREARQSACLAVCSFYDHPRPWEKSTHLSRVYSGMKQRAEQVGYRLEPLWLRAPGMTYRRFRGILQARGLEGMLCFGSSDVDQLFPSEINLCAIVTVGLSIRTRLHRVVSHSFADTTVALDRLHQLGYRRPGLVVSNYEEQRSARAHTAAYLAWCERHLGLHAAMPILRVDEVEGAAVLGWLGRHKPEAIVVVHQGTELLLLRSALRKAGVRVPGDLGVLAISPVLEGTDFAGLEENQSLIGRWAVELLAARIANRDFGIPLDPRVEMVESQWHEGNSLRVFKSVNC